MRNAVSIIAFGLRHFLAVCLAMIIGCVVWTVIYLLLLLYAICFNEGLGGPLAYPTGLIAIGFACSFVGWGIFTPATGIGRIFCWLTQLPLLAAIPVVAISAFGLSYLLAALVPVAFLDESMPSVWIILKYFTLYLSIPLAIYWWLTEGPGALSDAIMRWLASRSEKSDAEPANIALK
ncbi:MAG: hypothetical protein ACSHX9_08980 [Luteolibacter sp.]